MQMIYNPRRKLGLDRKRRGVARETTWGPPLTSRLKQRAAHHSAHSESRGRLPGAIIVHESTAQFIT